MASPGKHRRAIYTRKSTEDGLDQAFNSLDAQREACAAYVMSQRHEGWTLVPDLDDDGGFSGGSRERLGLKRLFADIEAGRVDVIVVHKVDPLTRSLADFAKIGDVLDADDPVGVKRGAQRGWAASWETSLEQMTYRLYGCKCINIKGAGNIRIDAIGRESARVTGALMIPYLKAECLKRGRELAGSQPEITVAKHQRNVGNALVLRIAKLVQARDAAENVTHTATAKNVLVALDRIKQVILATYGETTSGRKTKIGISRDAIAAADGLGLHRQATETTNLLIAN